MVVERLVDCWLRTILNFSIQFSSTLLSNTKFPVPVPVTLFDKKNPLPMSIDLKQKIQIQIQIQIPMSICPFHSCDHALFVKKNL
jgi:hypothetical protein